jgi:Fe-S cluster biogenesis protein NfuA
MDPGERIARLTAELDRLRDPEGRRVAEGLMDALLELQGEGLRRIFATLDEQTRRVLAADELVGGMLMIHDLHPIPLQERVEAGLELVRPYMASHGGDVELLSLDQGVARLRLQGNCNGCAASASTLELAVEKALEETAPDLLGLEVEGTEALHPPPAAECVTGTPLPMA